MHVGACSRGCGSMQVLEALRPPGHVWHFSSSSCKLHNSVQSFFAGRGEGVDRAPRPSHHKPWGLLQAVTGSYKLSGAGLLQPLGHDSSLRLILVWCPLPLPSVGVRLLCASRTDLCGYLRAFPPDAGRDGPFLQLMGTRDGGAFAVLPHLLTSKVGAML